jgi:uncharacterized membrane protein
MRENLTSSIVTLCFICAGLGFWPRSAAAQSYNFFTTIDVPCSAAPPTNCPNGKARATSAQGINAGGDVVGFYIDGVGKTHGYLLRGGQFTTIEVPGSIAGVAGNLPTAARGINAGGEIVGSYTAPFNPPVSTTVGYDSPAYCPALGSPACIKGFLYSSGQFSVVLVPGHPGVIAQRITQAGDIYGCLHDFLLMDDMLGFVRTRFGYASLAVHGGELADGSLTKTDSMNNGATPDGRTIVGGWTDLSTGLTFGFLVKNGGFETYDAPAPGATWIWDINPAGAFVGFFHDTRNHGYIQLPDGSAPITLDPQNSINASAIGINPGGTVVGQYTDTSGHVHGFIVIPD